MASCWARASASRIGSGPSHLRTVARDLERVESDASRWRGRTETAIRQACRSDDAVAGGEPGAVWGLVHLLVELLVHLAERTSVTPFLGVTTVEIPAKPGLRRRSGRAGKWQRGRDYPPHTPRTPGIRRPRWPDRNGIGVGTTFGCTFTGGGPSGQAPSPARPRRGQRTAGAAPGPAASARTAVAIASSSGVSVRAPKSSYR